LELVAHRSANDRMINVWKEGSIPIDHAIRRFYAVTISEKEKIYKQTDYILTNKLGFNLIQREENRLGISRL
jgi:hypothetical protein